MLSSDLEIPEMALDIGKGNPSLPVAKPAIPFAEPAILVSESPVRVGSLHAGPVTAEQSEDNAAQEEPVTAKSGCCSYMSRLFRREGTPVYPGGLPFVEAREQAVVVTRRQGVFLQPGSLGRNRILRLAGQ